MLMKLDQLPLSSDEHIKNNKIKFLLTELATDGNIVYLNEASGFSVRDPGEGKRHASCETAYYLSLFRDIVSTAQSVSKPL